MAKKTSRRKRRQRKPNVPRYTPPAEKAVVDGAVDGAAPAIVEAVRETPASASASAMDWAAEYPHVLSDLRNILIVSVLMLALLITLNFVLV